MASKADMWDKILTEFYQPDKNILKGSGFVTDAFGPLTEPLKLCLNPNLIKGVTFLPLIYSVFIPEWGPGLSMLHLKPLKFKKTPFQVIIMVQRGVKGFGAEKRGSPGDRMTQGLFII